MTNSDELLLYHKCGTTIIQETDGTFRSTKPSLGRMSILICPTCGAVLRDRDLYCSKADIAREKLRDEGWYPDPNSLALIDEDRRSAILATLQEALDEVGDADLLAIYTIVADLTE
ncbi:MAG TPA: hypothetical protein ENN19_00110 [Chloroflexi bacterium]|mgnify:CR=1 FL=1|nr:hypothetical protein [Chloroflexota bacterium]